MTRFTWERSAIPAFPIMSRCGDCSFPSVAVSKNTSIFARHDSSRESQLHSRAANPETLTSSSSAKSEGEYSEVGGRVNRNTESDTAIQEVIFTRRAVDRIIRYAFELARTRKKHVTSATKSNGIVYTMPFWDERFAAISKEYADVKSDQFHIDILTAHFVAHPDWFDVVVGSNLFGDILSDLGAAVVGSMGLAPSANLNPEREYPSMFEPVHGSAPDIAGKGIANPVAQIWSGAMMLDHLGEKQAARTVEQAIFNVLAASAVRTQDVGGNASTRDMGEAIAAEVSATMAAH